MAARDMQIPSSPVASTSAVVVGLHHVTIGCAAKDLPTLLQFYTEVIGLRNGSRPSLRFPGHWLYVEDGAILHLNALLDEDHPQYGLSTIDHVSFRARNLRALREHLNSTGVRFTEVPLSGTTLHQVFLFDCVGTKVELTFDLLDESA